MFQGLWRAGTPSTPSAPTWSATLAGERTPSSNPTAAKTVPDVGDRVLIGLGSGWDRVGTGLGPGWDRPLPFDLFYVLGLPPGFVPPVGFCWVVPGSVRLLPGLVSGFCPSFHRVLSPLCFLVSGRVNQGERASKAAIKKKEVNIFENVYKTLCNVEISTDNCNALESSEGHPTLVFLISFSFFFGLNCATKG